MASSDPDKLIIPPKFLSYLEKHRIYELFKCTPQEKIDRREVSGVSWPSYSTCLTTGFKMFHLTLTSPPKQNVQDNHCAETTYNNVCRVVCLPEMPPHTATPLTITDYGYWSFAAIRKQFHQDESWCMLLACSCEYRSTVLAASPPNLIELAADLVVQRPSDHVTFLREVLVRLQYYRDRPRLLILAPPHVDMEKIAECFCEVTGAIPVSREDINTLSVQNDEKEEVTTPETFALRCYQLLRTSPFLEKGWILVDFPKTYEEANMLQRAGVYPTHVIQLVPSILSSKYFHFILLCTVLCRTETDKLTSAIAMIQSRAKTVHGIKDYRRKILPLREAYKNVIQASMDQRRNERAGKTEDPRENPPTSGIVRHDPRIRINCCVFQFVCSSAGSTPPLNRVLIECSARCSGFPGSRRASDSRPLLEGTPLTLPRIRTETRVTVAERLDYSPPAKANRVQSPAGSLRIFASESRAGRCHRSEGFLGSLPFPPPRRCPHFTLIGSQDLGVKRRPNLSTQVHETDREEMDVRGLTLEQVCEHVALQVRLSAAKGAPFLPRLLLLGLRGLGKRTLARMLSQRFNIVHGTYYKSTHLSVATLDLLHDLLVVDLLLSRCRLSSLEFEVGQRRQPPFIIIAEAQSGGVLGPLYHPDGCSLCGLRKFPSPDRKEHIAQRSGRPARPGATQTARQSDQQSRGSGGSICAVSNPESGPWRLEMYEGSQGENHSCSSQTPIRHQSTTNPPPIRHQSSPILLTNPPQSPETNGLV
ncbi:hypothetical protein PR048_022912, partial [Dryococelus australis]